MGVDFSYSRSANDIDVSVLICAFNEEGYIQNCIQSVFQNCSKDISLEVVVVDDCSTDSTLKLLLEMQEKDPRIRVLSRVEKTVQKENYDSVLYIVKPKSLFGGLAEALNIGLEYCYGKFIARLDADDKCINSRISKQVNYLKQNPKIDFVASAVEKVTENGSVISRKPRVLHPDSASLKNAIFKFSGYLPHPTWMLRREVVDKMKGYDPFGYRAEDLDFLLRVSENEEISISFIEEKLILQCQRSSGLTYMPSSKQIYFAIHAMVRSILRRGNRGSSAERRGDIMVLVERAVKKRKLDSLMAAYSLLVQSYAAYYDKKYFDVIVFAVRAAVKNHRVFFCHNKMAEIKLDVANAICKEFLGQ